MAGADVATTQHAPGPLAREATRFLHEHALYTADMSRSCPIISDELFNLLGCRVLKTMVLNKPPTSENMAAVQEYLPKLLRTAGDPIDQATMLDGLYRHGCWRTCLLTLSDAYDLAHALLSYLAFSGISKTMLVATRHSVLCILNEWLEPANAWTELPGDLDACRHMFSAVWCDLSLPDKADSGAHRIEYSAQAACYLMQKDLPPFLPGLCAAQSDTLGVLLPDLATT